MCITCAGFGGIGCDMLEWVVRFTCPAIRSPFDLNQDFVLERTRGGGESRSPVPI